VRGAIAFKRATALELDDERCIVGETHTLPYAVRITQPGVVNVFLKLTTAVYLAALPRAGPTGSTISSRRSGRRREGRQRLPNHPPEREPGDPPRGHAAQRGSARANRRDFLFYEKV